MAVAESEAEQTADETVRLNLRFKRVLRSDYQSETTIRCYRDNRMLRRRVL